MFELFDVVVGAESRLGPDLLAEQFGELAFELADAGILTRCAALGVGQVAPSRALVTTPASSPPAPGGYFNHTINTPRSEAAIRQSRPVR